MLTMKRGEYTPKTLLDLVIEASDREELIYIEGNVHTIRQNICGGRVEGLVRMLTYEDGILLIIPFND